MFHVSIETFRDDEWAEFLSFNADAQRVRDTLRHALNKNLADVRITIVNVTEANADTFTDADELNAFLTANW